MGLAPVREAAHLLRLAAAAQPAVGAMGRLHGHLPAPVLPAIVTLIQLMAIKDTHVIAIRPHEGGLFDFYPLGVWI
jgi:hypothetical protein